MKTVSQSQGISVYEKIKTDILFARLAPGEKLRVKMLSEQHSCGASPIREALNQLASDGWVERIDRRGFFVSPVSEESFEDLYFNRCFLETEALKRSIRFGGDDWEERIVLSHYRLSSIRREDPSSLNGVDPYWESAHKKFHMSLLSACRSEILLSHCEKLYDLNIRYRCLSGKNAQAERDVPSEHEAIRDATLRRDPEAATEALVGHYRKTGDFLFRDRGPLLQAAR